MFSSSHIQQQQHQSSNPRKKYISTIKHYRCLSTSTSPKERNKNKHNYNSQSNSNMKITSSSHYKTSIAVMLINSSKSKSKDSKYKTININSANSGITSNNNIKKRKRNNIKYITQLYPKTERKKITSQSTTTTNTNTNGITNNNNGKEFISIKTTSTLTSSIISNNNSQITLNTIDSIFIKLKSNWGHSSLIGVHCINLYTSHKTLIKVISTTISYEHQRMSSCSNIQTVKQHNTCNNNDITSIKFIKGQIAVIEIKYNAITLIKEIELINSKHPNKSISAKEILICNIKGELIYADTLQKGGRIHIEKGINGLFIPIKHRIVVNRKQNNNNNKYNNSISNSSPIKRESNDMLFKRVNSNDTLFKMNSHFNNNNHNHHNNITKVKTLTNFPTAITNNQLVALLHNSRCLTSRYNNNNNNKVQFDTFNYSSQTQRTTNNYVVCSSNNNNNNNNQHCVEYITCNKITIILLSNYGHNEHIGLTGIEIYDDNGIVDVANRAKGIWTQPKDLNTVYNDNYDDRIFENTFNGINNTTNQSHMWLTCLLNETTTTSKPYIEITFGDDINLNYIKFYNYNHPLSKEKGVKKCYILLHNKHNELIWESKIHLHKALGESEVDYGQVVKCRYDCVYIEDNSNCFTKDENDLILSLLNEDNVNKYYNEQIDNDYFVPYLPCGYIVKVELISNCGCDKYIGYKSVKIIDVKGDDVVKERNCRRVCVPKEEKGKDGDGVNGSCSSVIMKYVNLNKEIWNDEEGGDTCCRVYYVFNDVVCITRIVVELFWGDGNEEVNVNKFKLLVDDKLVYEGQVDMCNGDNNSNTSKTIWFVNH